MLRFLRPRTSSPRAHLEQEIAEIGALIRATPRGYETQLLNRAGDLCANSGQTERALEHYGRAIDLYLELGRYENAAAVCRKVLRIAPDAARPHCTLAWVEIGKEHYDEAGRAVDAYISAATRAGQQRFAVQQLQLMADATGNADLLARIAEHLCRLGHADLGERVFHKSRARQTLNPFDLGEDSGDVWAQLLRAALMSPEEMRARAQEAQQTPTSTPPTSEAAPEPSGPPRASETQNQHAALDLHIDL